MALAGSPARLWQRDTALKLKTSARASAKLLAMPDAPDYDLVVLGVAIAFFVRNGLRLPRLRVQHAGGAWIVPRCRGESRASPASPRLLAMLAYWIAHRARSALKLSQA